MALALQMRVELAPTAGSQWETVFYSWLDSSPTAGRDWLVGHMHLLVARSPKELLELARLQDSLILGTWRERSQPQLPVPVDDGACSGSGSDDDDLSLIHISEPTRLALI
eukprot:5927316-Alexandrium_andersonii.AAC.1